MIKKICEEYIKELKSFKDNSYEVHKKNLITKLENTINDEKIAIFKDEKDISKFIDLYIKYRIKINNLLNEIVLNPNNLENYQKEMINELEEYKKNAYLINNENKFPYFTSQSKYEPTILEEFIGFFLSPLINKIVNLKCGPVKGYSEMHVNIVIKNNIVLSNIEQKSKNQDFALYIEKKINDELTIQIPLIAIECKTYIDKTMLEGCINTAKRIKNGNLNSKFYIIAETLDIGENENINPNEIDNLFIIRKCKRRKNEKIDCFVLMDIFNIIKNDLKKLEENVNNNQKILLNGKLKV